MTPEETPTQAAVEWLRARISDRLKFQAKPPTIEELEAILNSEEGKYSLKILPSGEVRAVESIEDEHIAKVLTALEQAQQECKRLEHCFANQATETIKVTERAEKAARALKRLEEHLLQQLTEFTLTSEIRFVGSNARLAFAEHVVAAFRRWFAEGCAAEAEMTEEVVMLSAAVKQAKAEEREALQAWLDKQDRDYAETETDPELTSYQREVVEGKRDFIEDARESIRVRAEEG